ncbi:MAG: ribosomal protein S18-alanine N-acetyltransferase [Peptoniphilaceae bacterium]
MINIREVTLGDLDEIYKIERSSFEDSWSKSLIENYISNLQNKKYLISDGEIIGFVFISKGYEEYSLDNIAILKKFRNKGYGELLLATVLDKVDNMDISLEVSVDNKRALGLYGKFGFKKEGFRKNYYGDGEDAIIMWRRSK